MLRLLALQYPDSFAFIKLRGSNQAAIAFGGLEHGPDSFSYLFAATIGREALREYFFSGLRYMFNTADENDFKPGKE